MIARRFLVAGLVQGVGFRLFTLRAARECRVLGWVRNLPDGRVEILAEGEEARVQEFREQIRRGPRHAIVEDLRETEESPSGRFSGFDMRP